DLVWAASSLHEVAAPDRLLRDVYGALNPGGVLVVIEMDAPPRFLPDDVGRGRPGLASRCHEALAQANWNSHPNWGPQLERAGFAIAAQRSFSTEAGAAPGPGTIGRYAHAYLGRIRPALDGQLAGDDLTTLDRLLAPDRPDALLRRRDLTVRGSRTAWAARRP
ncbi:MAG: SAM-dependent methyltransferase, partial [Candidatus Dormiibacterota bacterium]